MAPQREGNFLELDIFLPGISVAIEIQGPHHYEDLFGKPEVLDLRQRNDLLKVTACLSRGVSTIWMRDVPVMKELMRRPLPERLREIASAVFGLSRTKQTFGASPHRRPRR